jgi:hypothetical protein
MFTFADINEYNVTDGNLSGFKEYLTSLDDILKEIDILNIEIKRPERHMKKYKNEQLEYERYKNMSAWEQDDYTKKSCSDCFMYMNDRTMETFNTIFRGGGCQCQFQRYVAKHAYNKDSSSQMMADMINERLVKIAVASLVTLPKKVQLLKNEFVRFSRAVQRKEDRMDFTYSQAIECRDSYFRYINISKLDVKKQADEAHRYYKDLQQREKNNYKISNLNIKDDKVRENELYKRQIQAVKNKKKMSRIIESPYEFVNPTRRRSVRNRKKTTE